MSKEDDLYALELKKYSSDAPTTVIKETPTVVDTVEKVTAPVYQYHKVETGERSDIKLNGMAVSTMYIFSCNGLS